jgi:hypothetical protein
MQGQFGNAERYQSQRETKERSFHPKRDKLRRTSTGKMLKTSSLLQNFSLIWQRQNEEELEFKKQ